MIHRFLRALVILVGCISCTLSENSPASDSLPTWVVHTTQRANFQIIGRDTLTDSAYVVRLLPETDANAIVAVFADPGDRISNGLAIVDRRMEKPELLWPDSVTEMWWIGTHQLAFSTQTGKGVRIVVDIHTAKADSVDLARTAIIPVAQRAVLELAIVNRAGAFLDSLHPPVSGSSQGTGLKYSVQAFVPSPSGRLIAFHSTAEDKSGVISNPAWFILDRETGAILLVDQVIGSVGELPKLTGAWAGDDVFFYVKGRTMVWQAEISSS